MYYLVPKRITPTSLQGKKLVRLWNGILARYTSANLTVRSDNLPALSGIAKHLQHITGATYLAGVLKPEQDAWFFAHLAWESRKPYSPRPSEYRSPSWSWASTDNAVQLRPTVAGGSSYQKEGKEPHAVAKVIAAEVTPATVDPTGSVASASLVLESYLYKISVRPAGDQSDSGVADAYDEKLGLSIVLGEPLVEEAVMYALPLYGYMSLDVRQKNSTDEEICVYLLLSLQDGEGDLHYTRSGMGRSYHGEEGVDHPLVGSAPVQQVVIYSLLFNHSAF